MKEARESRADDTKKTESHAKNSERNEKQRREVVLKRTTVLPMEIIERSNSDDNKNR